MKSPLDILSRKSLILFFILFCAVPMLAADRYVSTTGSDDANGLTEGTAYATIQKGLDNIDSHSTIWVKADGVYNISAKLDVGTSGQDVDIKGYYSTIRDQDPGGAYYQDASNGWTVIDVNDDGDVTHVFDISFLVPEKSFVEFWNLKVQDVNLSTKLSGNQSNTIGVGFINCWFADGGQRFYLNNVCGILFLDCKFEGAWKPGGANIFSGIIGLERPPSENKLSNAVINCEFDVDLQNDSPVVIGQGFNTYDHPNDTAPLFVSGCSILSKNHKTPTKGIKTSASIAFNGPAYIINNSIHCTDSSASNGIYAGCYADTSILINNIIDGFSVDVNDSTGSVIYCPSADGFSAGVYRLYNCVPDDAAANATEITDNPLWANPVNADFRLKRGSPCLNKGSPTRENGFTSMGSWQKKQGGWLWPWR